MAQVRTEAEMFPLVESWQKSGLTQKQFSQQHKVSEHVFCYWVMRYRRGQPVAPVPNSERIATNKPITEPAATFIRLSAPTDAVAPTTTGTDVATVVELPSGVVVRFSGLMPVAYLKELVGLNNTNCSCSA